MVKALIVAMFHAFLGQAILVQTLQAPTVATPSLAIDGVGCNNYLSTVTSVACTASVTIGDAFIVGASDRDGLITSISDSTNGAYTKLFYLQDATNPAWAGQWYFVGSAAATGNVTFTASASGSDQWMTLSVTPIKPVNGSTVLLDSGPVTQSQASTSGTIPNPTCGATQTPSQNNELIVTYLQTDGGETVTPGTNYTLYLSNANGPVYVTYWNQIVATATNGPYTATADDWIEGCAAFKP